MSSPTGTNGTTTGKSGNDKTSSSTTESSIHESSRNDYFSNSLYSTLQLNEVLQYFFEEIQDAVVCEGLVFHDDSSNASSTNLSFGQDKPYTRKFWLCTADNHLCELSFSRSREFSDNDIGLLETLLSQLIPPLRNALLYQEAVQAAFMDPLTHLKNRKGLDDTLARELELSQRYQQPLSVLMIDIDHFKQINDDYGHQIGDDILQNLADILIITARQSDLMFRYGGDEFLVILSNADSAGAFVIAERIRESIDSSIVINDEITIDITVSIGSATLTFAENQQQLIKRADDALYAAKARGRNNVVNLDSDSIDNSSATDSTNKDHE